MSDFREMRESMHPSRSDLSKAINQKIAYRKKCEQLEAENKDLLFKNDILESGIRDYMDMLERLKKHSSEAPSAIEQPNLVKQACRTCIFVLGAFSGAIACLMVLQAKGLLG